MGAEPSKHFLHTLDYYSKYIIYKQVSSGRKMFFSLFWRDGEIKYKSIGKLGVQ